MRIKMNKPLQNILLIFYAVAYITGIIIGNINEVNKMILILSYLLFFPSIGFIYFVIMKREN